MYFSLDLLNNLQSPAIYISNPNHKILKPLLGICSARANFQLRDIWEIDFEVDAFMSDHVGVRVPNPSYELITHSRELWIKNIGWFRINTYPSEQIDDNGRKYKSFTAYGYETTLQDLDLVGININCGTEDSIEMYEENLDVFGVPMHNIQLYIKDANEDPKSDKYWKLGLLNILEHEYLHKKGWRIGDIDIGVAPLKGRQFEIDSENIYAFLTQDVSNAYRCMFWFDRINKTINAVKVENLGKDLNLELSFRNVLTAMSITDQNDDFYTCFRVADWTFTVSSATGVVGTLSSNTYKVTNLTANTGNVILTASRSGYDKLQKKLIVTKIKGGQPGRTYILSASSLVLNRSSKGVYAPTSITFSASYRDGNSTESTNYAGRFKVEETLDGTKYTLRYTSTSNETNYIYTPPNTLIKTIRCTLYAAGGTSQVLDMQSVVVLDDIDISDIDDKFDHITESMSTISSKVDAVEKKIVNMVTQTDIDTAINKYDGSTVKTIRDRVSKTEQDITGLRTTVSDVESKFDGSVHTLSEKISKVEQDATKFQTTVSETYATKDELSSTSNSMTSQYTQLANKFSWIVKSGTSSSNFEITDRFIALTSQALNIDALVTFKNAATSGSSTVINGGAIDTDSLFARSITATGTITGGTFIGSKIQSKNYVADSAGSIFDMDSGKINIGNGKFVFDGNNLVLTGNVTATAGYIGGTGGWKITSNQITGNANSKIISGILQSTNFVDKSSGVQINLNNGIIKGNIEASTLAAKENFQC